MTPGNHLWGQGVKANYTSGGLWDLSSPTRDRTRALSSESAESQLLDCQGILPIILVLPPPPDILTRKKLVQMDAMCSLGGQTESPTHINTSRW